MLECNLIKVLLKVRLLANTTKIIIHTEHTSDFEYSSRHTGYPFSTAISGIMNVYYQSHNNYTACCILSPFVLSAGIPSTRLRVVTAQHDSYMNNHMYRAPLQGRERKERQKNRFSRQL